MIDTTTAPAKYGVSISTTTITAVKLDAGNNVIDSRETICENSAGLTTEAARIISDIGGGDIHGTVGIAVPGLIADGGSIAFSSRIPEHSGIEIAVEISRAAGVEVHIENDANAAAYGEMILGQGKGKKSLFYATLGEGVGGALLLDEEIWRGATGFAGEFGSVAIDPEGTRLEDVASAANIVRRTRERFRQDATSSLGTLEEASLTLSDILNAAEAGDDFAQMMLERTGNYVGAAIATVINLLNPEMVIVGGSSLDPRGSVIKAIRETAERLSFKPSFDATDIVVAELGANGPAIGAALLASRG